jgi:hypothetical protein
MLIPLPNITYNVQEAIDYYKTVKHEYLDLMWTKNEWLDYLQPPFTPQQEEETLVFFTKMTGKTYQELGMSKDQCIKLCKEKGREFTKDVTLWNIKYDGNHPKLDRQQELQFGFAKKILDIFPFAHDFELIVNPVGTRYLKHTDNGSSIRVIIPIISDEGAIWHFDNIENVTHFPGHAYLLLKQFAHGTDVLGPADKVTLAFLVDSNHYDYITALSCRI